MNRTPSAVELRNAKRPNVDVAKRNMDDRSATTEIESTTDKLLREIRDLLKTRGHGEEKERHEDDKESEMKNDWMLAAAVLDRICGIAFTVILVAGTTAFFVLFAMHP